jgi:hypothetical protein
MTFDNIPIPLNCDVQALLGGKPLQLSASCDAVPVSAAERAAAAAAAAAASGATEHGANSSSAGGTIRHLAELLLHRLHDCELEGSLAVRRVLQARLQDWMHVKQQQQQHALDDMMQQQLHEAEAFLSSSSANGEAGGAGWRQVEDTSSGRVWYINAALGAVREQRAQAVAAHPSTASAASASSSAAAARTCVGLIQLQLLPGGSGALSSDTLILFFQPSSNCDVPTCHALFIECALYAAAALFCVTLCPTHDVSAGTTSRPCASWAAALQQ